MSKAGIWLLPVITLAVSLTRLVLLTAQHLPQPTANETIERWESKLAGMLEISVPAAQDQIEWRNNAFNAGPVRLGSDCGL